jgi:hypothetical protein
MSSSPSSPAADPGRATSSGTLGQRNPENFAR